jgi:hypothetical protein
MTVAQLIAKLQDLPPDLPILIPFGDLGFEEVNTVTAGQFVRDEYAETACYYIGRHDQAYVGGLKDTEPCVYLTYEDQDAPQLQP